MKIYDIRLLRTTTGKEHICFFYKTLPKKRINETIDIFKRNVGLIVNNQINDIKINIKNLHVHIDNVNISKQGNLQELERKIDLLNSKIDILNNNLNKDFIQEMLELASSIPGMEVIAKLLEKLYEMLK